MYPENKPSNEPQQRPPHPPTGETIMPNNVPTEQNTQSAPQATQNPVITQTNTNTTGQPQPRSGSQVLAGLGGVLGALFSWVLLPAGIVLVLHFFVFQAYHVQGSSMFPTLHDADYLIVSKLGETKSKLKNVFMKDTTYIPPRGEIIVFHYPGDTTKVFVKRVVGLPGDRVVISNGTVTVFNESNPTGFNPDKGYESENAQTLKDTDEVVQPDHVFVMGDNRTPGGSFDSRDWGQLATSYIIGDTVLRLLPVDQAKAF